ncbi:MAG: hypothetical protein LUG54_08295 [Clostridiales bacterium]|nr:hypothetical protein [Clostridiales bacterium]
MKKGKGRWMAFLLAIVLSLTMIPGYVAAAQDSEYASVPENTESENEVQADQSNGTELGV